MKKCREIKFQSVRGALRGRRNGMEFWIYETEDMTGACDTPYYVVIYEKSNAPQNVNTGGHEYFTLDGAKAFCQKIAEGEIMLEDLQAFYDTKDAAKERAVFREITAKAKEFHARLDAMGLSYRGLLELEVLAHGLGDMGHNILLGYERGEGWPECSD